MPESQPLRLALVDDHTLFRRGLASLIEMINSRYQILFEADNGNDLINKIDKKNLPDIILMDINMPGMDGFASVKWLKKNYPTVKVLVVSMVNQEESILRLIQLGVKGYVSKDVEPEELNQALESIQNKGFYYTDFITGKLLHSLQTDTANGSLQSQSQYIFNRLLDYELELLKWTCTDLTYHEIAEKMLDRKSVV